MTESKILTEVTRLLNRYIETELELGKPVAEGIMRQCFRLEYLIRLIKQNGRETPEDTGL